MENTGLTTQEAHARAAAFVARARELRAELREELPNLLPLEITATHLERQAVVLAVSGELDLASCPRLAEVVDSWRTIEDTVCLDLEQVAFIDSTGLRLLLGLTEPAQDGGGGGGAVYLVGAGPAVRRVAKISGTLYRLGLAT